MTSSGSDNDYDDTDSCRSSDTSDDDTDSGNSSDTRTTTEATERSTEAESEDEEEDVEDQANIVWSGLRKNIPTMIFRPESVFKKVKRLYLTGEKYHLAYKMVRTECKVVRQILQKHGFHDVHPNSSDFNIMWTGSHVKPYVLRTMTEFQKINHFPRSYEITRKDRLYKNFQRMQQSKGSRHFDFLPQTFVTPVEFDDLSTAHMKERGTWIVKPVASSRGRGISLINNPQHVPMDGNHVVSRYISNPLLIDGFKFDCRLYVAVTSFDPLRAYLYEEGLARFATVQYNHTNKTIKNVMMHLTNYSLNKRSNDYVRCNDLNVEDYGNKWSFGAMVRYLRKKGKDVKAMLGRIEEVVIKTLLCAELPVATACKMFMPHRGNCYELYGFDILMDENLKPWVLEVNLSPSLACDAPMDLKIKSNMVGDLFSLTGIIAQDPMMRRVQQSKRNQELAATNTLRQQRQRPHSAGVTSRPTSAKKTKEVTAPSGDKTLTAEERRVISESKDEYQRRGGWLRIFPSPVTGEKYKNFLESRTTMNHVLHRGLYPDNLLAMSSSGTGLFTRAKKVTGSVLHELADRELEEHLAQFMRKLETSENVTGRKQVRTKVRHRFPSVKRMFSAGVMRSCNNIDDEHREQLPQGKLENTTSTITQAPKPTTSQQQKNQLQKNQQQKNQLQKNQQQKSQQQKNQPVMKTDDSERSSQASVTSGQEGGVGKDSTGQQPVGKPPSGDNKGVRMVLEVQKQPSAKEIRESMDVPAIVNHGGDISKLQARLAFATYLLRVQQRLLEETNNPAESLDESPQNDEQMDLVLRFLKRAANNLQHPFKVIVPSRKLPGHDRRRILAKQLKDFVQIYNKETDQMDLRRKMDQKSSNNFKDKENVEAVPEDRFSQFTGIASEQELEELLTIYTKQNKSASIFLGTSNPQANDYKAMSDITAHTVPSASGSNTNMRQSTSEDSTGDDKTKGAGDAVYPVSQMKRPQSTPSSGLRHSPSDTAVMSAYATHNSSNARQRPMSAKVTPMDSAARLFSESSQQAIQDALQRLARRQAVRQYSASSSHNQNLVAQQYLQHYNIGGSGGITTGGPSLNPTGAARASHPMRGESSLSVNNSNNHYHTRNAWDGVKSHSTSILDNNGPSRTITSRRPVVVSNVSPVEYQHSQESGESATETDRLGYGESESVVRRDTGAYPVERSHHFQHAMQQDDGLVASSNQGIDDAGRVAQKQPLSLQEKKQISHEMTQQSRAKHLEKVAQAHSTASLALREALHLGGATTSSNPGVSQYHQHRSGSSAVSYHMKPRPPVRSPNARKPVSFQRMARTTQLDEPSGDTFYTGLKYNSKTGTSKPSAGIYNSGLQSAVVRH